MTAYNNNASILAVVAESTSGTLVAPSSDTEYMALQTGFELSPEVEVIETEEIKASIGASKTLTGLEKPTASWRHYLRHSGTEGVTADWNLLAKSIFGSTTINSTERTTDAASTVSLLKVTAGGADFAAKGFAVLVKDSTITGGYSIRPIDSRSSNDLTPGFNFPSAPAAGAGVGKCINYTPVSSGHPTLSVWLYRANGAAIEAVAGAQVTQMDISVEVGQPLNVSYTLGGTKYFFNPLIVSASNNKLNFTDDDGTVTATITNGAYRTPIELAAAVTAAMNSANAGQVHSCTYSSVTGKFTITSTGTVLSLLWKTGTNGSDNTDTHIGTLLGYSDAADDSGTAAATGYASDTAQSYANAITPALDSTDPLIARDMEVLLGDAANYFSLCVQSMNINIGLETTDVTCISSSSGIDSKLPVKRTTAIEMTTVLSKYDADKFDRFFNKTETKFLFNFGAKSGGNWVAGRCGCVYAPQAALSSFRVGESGGAVTMVITINPYVDASGNPEIYLNLL